MRMKTIKPLQILFILVTLLLAGCLPDSFTKFHEDPPVSQGSTAPAPTPTPTPTEAPKNFTYDPTTIVCTVDPETEDDVCTEIPGEGAVVAAFTVGVAIANIPVGRVDNFPDTYTVSPALPTGLLLNAVTGEISGTPTTYSPVTVYVITASNSAGSVNTNLTLSALTQPAGLRVNTQTLIHLSVGSAANYGVGGPISSQLGGSGTVMSISGNQIAVQVISGIFSSTAPTNNIANTATYVSSDTTVVEVDYDLKQKLKITDTTGLVSGTTITNSLGQYGSITEVINSTEFVVGVFNGTFNTTDLIDDQFPFAVTRDVITEMSFIYFADQLIDIRPTIATGEDIVYSTTNALAVNFSPFSPVLGWIQGTQVGATFTQITLTATNSTGSASITFSMGPEESAPKNMNYAQDLILTVTSTSAFTRGEEVTSADLLGSGLGKVKRIVDSNTLHVRLIKGFFNPGTGLDNTSPYAGEKAEILNVAPVTTVLYVDNGTSVSFGKNSFISSFGDAAQGIIAHVDPNGGGEDIIYVHTYKGSFIVGDIPLAVLGISNTEFYDGSNEATVNNIEAPNIKMKVVDIGTVPLPKFPKGSQFTNALGATGKVRDSDIATNYVYVAVDYDGFTWIGGNDDVDNFNPYSASETTISEISADRSFYYFRGEEIRINAFLRKGSSPAWSIIPALPAGLELDDQTGHISGTSLESAAKKVYTVTAMNLIDGIQYEETFSFFLQIYDHFTISDQTVGATSYILHQEGKKNGGTDCRITSDDILGAIQSNKDIICRLEAEEKDVYQTGISLNVSSSPGLCQYMVHTPYNFYARSAAATTTQTTLFKNTLASGADCDVTAADDDTNDICVSDYTDELFGKKNCDEGSYTLTTIEWSGGTSGNPCTISAIADTTEVTCNGLAGQCTEGPVRDIGVDADVFTGISSNSANGLDLTFNYISPLEGSDIGVNRRLVNYVGNNDCSDAGAGTNQHYRYQAKNWIEYATASYPQAGATQTATISRVATTLTSSQLARSFFSTSEDLRADFQVGDVVEVNWGAFGVGNHKIESITATDLIFFGAVNYAIPGATNFAISPHLLSEPFKGNRTNPFYTFECQDAAQDTLARVRIQVRDWDRKFSIDDDIDRLGKVHPGTVTIGAPATILTGTVSFVGEFPSNPTDSIFPMLKFGNQVNQPAAQTIIGTSFLLTQNTTDAVTAQPIYSRPLLMDSGNSIDLFNNRYNDHSDWDDTNLNGAFPYLNSCGGVPVPPAFGVAPTRDSQRRDSYFDFLGVFYK